MTELTDELLGGDVIARETPPGNVFTPPSVHAPELLSGESYTHHSATPTIAETDHNIEWVMGIDEAGRGPVLGPMVYAVFYLPISLHRSLLAEKYHFDDSKVLTPAFRSELMRSICNPSTDLFQNCGWATRSLSARDISSGQLHPSAAYNLNAQAQDATTSLIQGVLDKGVNIREVYVDTIGPPATYQKRLERLFPALSFTVAKKADSLYPCVSAASVCAKVTRDAALDVLWSAWSAASTDEEVGWGSGYPSDARCSSWLKQNVHALFGWGNECRFSWGTAKELLESKNAPCHVQWPESDTEGNAFNLSSFFMGANDNGQDELADWYGPKTTAEEVF